MGDVLAKKKRVFARLAPGRSCHSSRLLALPGRLQPGQDEVPLAERPPVAPPRDRARGSQTPQNLASLGAPVERTKRSVVRWRRRRSLARRQRPIRRICGISSRRKGPMSSEPRAVSRWRKVATSRTNWSQSNPITVPCSTPQLVEAFRQLVDRPVVAPPPGMIQADTDLNDPLHKPLDGSARQRHPPMLQMLVGLEEQARH